MSLRIPTLAVQILFFASLVSAAVLAYFHPGLAAIRIGLAVVYGVPAICLGIGIFQARPKSIAASLFLALMLIMPLMAEIWSEPEIRGLALISSILTACYVVGAIVYIRQLPH